MASNDLAQSNFLSDDLDLDSIFLKELDELSKPQVSHQTNFSFLDVSLRCTNNSSDIISSSKKKQQRNSFGNRMNSRASSISRELFLNKAEADEFQNILESLNSKPKLRTRVKLNDVQQDVLEEEFKLNRYPEAIKIEKLASTLDLTFQKVTTWFQNKRARLKKTQTK